jgi:EAL domain-containing protein (putative c-di-GMP-specific phosphodiesterase class I)
VEEPILIDDASICISASIGVTLYPDDSSDPDILLRHADQAMYLAKEGGKHRYQFFDPERDRQVQSHRDQLLRLDQALDRREFTLHYQPKVDLISGEVIGAEALIRWQHPDRGLVAPAEFLQYMEGTELEVRVGEWVIDSVLRQITDWKSAGLAFTVSANVSAHHVLQPDFSERLRLIMQRHPQVASGDLELEIVETAALANMTQAIRALTQCRQLGVHIALDDFGTGYSSLTYFRSLPVDMLKVDQSFVRDMLEDPDALGIVESVVRLARAFNRPVIAEGVETLEHGAMLVQLGCRFAQGHGIARPMPAEQIGAWVKQWSRQAGWRNLDCTVMVAENTTLMIAARSHRIWTDKMVELISRPQSEVPDFVDSEYCQFGRWYRGSGAAQYGEYPEYRAIAPLHDAAHATASELITLAGGSKPEIARDRVSELHAAHDRLLAQIEALSERLATDARESKPGPHAGS